MAKSKVTAIGVLLTLILLIVPAQTVFANDIKVDVHCSLIEAIGSANNDSSKARCETGYREDTILLKENVVLDEELPVIKSKITIEGNGYAIFVRQRNPAFTIKYGDLTIRNLRVKFRGENRAGPTIEIRNGSITIIDSKIQNCSGKFQIEDSQGVVIGNDYICGYKAETVNSWFGAAPPSPEPVTLPSIPHTCDALSGISATITATYGLQSGVQCQQVDARGIGIQSVIEAGFIDAVDVWGYVEQGVTICFPQPGAITFLDATTAPRSVVQLAAYNIDGTTCVALNRPGTVVLVRGQSPPQAEPATETEATVAIAEATVAIAEVTRTEQCQITTTGNLRLRSTPEMNYNIIGYVSRGTTLTPLSRTMYWNQVEYLGQVGWISNSPHYIHSSSTCA